MLAIVSAKIISAFLCKDVFVIASVSKEAGHGTMRRGRRMVRKEKLKRAVMKK
jgi:hypothetical protein